MEDLTEITYRIQDDILDQSDDLKDQVYNYEELAKIVENNSEFAQTVAKVKCDTPIRYNYRTRFGYISIERFLVRGGKVHYSLIENEFTGSSYIIHPDMAEKALGVEQNRLDMQGEDTSLVRRKEVVIPQLQVDLNTKEYYAW